MMSDAPDGLVRSSSGSATASSTQTLPHPGTASGVPNIPDHQLLRKIGGGSYGEVWLARNAVGTVRAIKIVWRKSFWHDQPFEREFKGLQKFEPLSREHEGLVDVLQIGRGEGYFYYVMELADDAKGSPRPQVRTPKETRVPKTDGKSPKDAAPDSGFGIPSDFGTRDSEFHSPRTLSSEIAHRGRLPISECIEIGLRLTSALEHLHRHKLVHRDVKPANIIFVGGAPKLADIGLVAEVSEARSYVGTEGYIPPEGPGTVRADIYSLGKLLYEISTGKDRHAFPELPNDLAEQREARQLVELNAVLVKAAQPDARRRYRSATEMHDELALLKSGHSVRLRRSRQQQIATVKRVAMAFSAVAIIAVLLMMLGAAPHGKAVNQRAAAEYKLGRWYLNQVTDESLSNAIFHVNRAIEIDPNYSDPYVALFEIYCWNVGDISDVEKSKKLRQIGDRLLTLNRKHAAGHAAVSFANYTDGHADLGEKEMQTALELDPNYASAHGLYGFWLSMQGRTVEALRELKQSQELDPTSRITATVAGFPLMAARDYDGAIAQFKKALELDPHLGFGFAHNWIGRALEAKGDYLAALEEYEKCDLLNGMDEIKVRAQFQTLRRAVAESSRAYWLKLRELVEKSYTPVQGHSVLTEEDRWPLTGIYARLEMKEEAIKLLEDEYQAGKREVFFNLDPSYDFLRGDSRFEEILGRLGLSR